MGRQSGRDLEPHRAWLLERVASQSHVSVRALSAELAERGIVAAPVSVWRVLKEAGLVIDTPDGTRRVYRLDPRGLGALRDWLDRFWGDQLTAFKDFADQQENPE